MKKNKKTILPVEGTSDDEYVHYCTYYDMEEYRRSVLLLTNSDIRYKVIDKSNTMNYRVPSSTWVEIGLFIHRSCFEKADKLLGSMQDNKTEH